MEKCENRESQKGCKTTDYRKQTVKFKAYRQSDDTHVLCHSMVNA